MQMLADTRAEGKKRSLDSTADKAQRGRPEDAPEFYGDESRLEASVKAAGCWRLQTLNPVTMIRSRGAQAPSDRQGETPLNGHRV